MSPNPDLPPPEQNWVGARPHPDNWVVTPIKPGTSPVWACSSLPVISTHISEIYRNLTYLFGCSFTGHIPLFTLLQIVIAAAAAYEPRLQLFSRANISPAQAVRKNNKTKKKNSKKKTLGWSNHHNPAFPISSPFTCKYNSLKFQPIIPRLCHS